MIRGGSKVIVQQTWKLTDHIPNFDSSECHRPGTRPETDGHHYWNPAPILSPPPHSVDATFGPSTVWNLGVPCSAAQPPVLATHLGACHACTSSYSRGPWVAAVPTNPVRRFI